MILELIEKQKNLIADLYNKRDWLVEDRQDSECDPEMLAMIQEDLDDLDELIKVEENKLRELCNM